jgi:hypothetical protein
VRQETGQETKEETKKAAPQFATNHSLEIQMI